MKTIISSWSIYTQNFTDRSYTEPGRSIPGRKETDMTRYIVTATRTLYGYETVFSFSNEADAKAKMEKLDADIRYTYTYRVEGGEE